MVCVGSSPSGTEWLLSHFWPLFSNKPDEFCHVMWTHGVLFSGDFIAWIVRQQLDAPPPPSGFSLRAYVVAHLFQSFVDDLCVQHGYAIDETPVRQKLGEVCLCRGAVILVVVQVTGDSEVESSGVYVRHEMESVAFVRGIYEAEGLLDGSNAVHLMSDRAAVCLPTLLKPTEQRQSELLPIDGGVCCKGRSPRVFYAEKAAFTISDADLREAQETWLGMGLELGPGPVELWFLRTSLRPCVFFREH